MKNILLAILILPLIISASAPSTISWQGILTDSEDNFLDGTYDITVKLYDTFSEGTELWSETHNDLTINNGLTNIVLGSISPFNLQFDQQYWLEIIIGEDDPLSRVALNSVPYSFYSERTNNVFVGDSLILKDSTGETKFILNPNSGTFKMMDNDTVWYSIKVNSPAVFDFLLPDNMEVVRDGNNTTYYRDGKKTEEYETYNNINGDLVDVYKDYDADGNLSAHNEYVSYYETDPSGEKHLIEILASEYYDEDGNAIRFENSEYKDGELVYEDKFEYEQKTHEKNVDITDNDEKYSKEETEKNYNNDVVIDFLNKVITYFKDDDGNYESDYQATTEKSYVSGNEYKRDFESVAVDGTAGNTSSIYETKEKKYFPGDDEYTYSERKVNGKTTSNETTKNGNLYEYDQFTDNESWKKEKNNFYDAAGEKTFEYEEEFDKTNKSKSSRLEDENGNFTTFEQFAEEFNFEGDVNVSNGEFSSKGPKKFRITNPNDNTKYLQHAAIESNEVLNQYSGNVTTGSDSLATVTLPDYIDDVNTDFRYQLTIVGTTFARAVIYSEISENEFTIKTDEPNITVSWQVTAKRNDTYMQNNPFEDEPYK